MDPTLKKQLNQEVVHILGEGIEATRTMETITRFIDLNYEEKPQSLFKEKAGQWLLDCIFEHTKIKRQAVNVTKLKERLKTFSTLQIKTAIKNAAANEYHINDNFAHLTAEIVCRNDAWIDKWIHCVPVKQKNNGNHNNTTTYNKL